MQVRVRKQVERPTSTRVDTLAGAGSVVSPDVYERARVAYIETGSVAGIRQGAGVSQAVAQRLLDSGEPSIGLPSLRDAARVHAAEVEKRLRLVEKASAEKAGAELASTLEARAKAARKAREHEGKVLGDAVAARADEVLLVRANRKSALVLASTNADLLRAGSLLARSLLEDPKALTRLPPKDRVELIRNIAAVVHRTAQASQTAVQMERLLMGEPTAILGRADAGPSTADMTLEEAEQWLHLANRAFARRAARKTVIDADPASDPSEPSEAVDELLEDLEPHAL